MKSSRMAVVMSALLGGAGVVALTMAGCSGDDTQVPPDATPDVAKDTAVPDVVDTGAPDAKDGGGDGEAGLSFQAFAAQQIAVICKRYSQCCFGADAAAFDQKACETANAGFGWEGNLQEPSSVQLVVPDGGDAAAPPNFKVDPVLAQQCLTQLSAFACPTIQATEDTAIFNACFGAVTGTLAVGNACTRSVECTTGNYCKAGDGGTYTCQPLEKQGGACDPDNQQNVGCQYRGYLGTAARCDYYLPDGGPGSKTCQARFPLGTNCNYGWECASGVCNATTYTCSTSTVTTTPFICDFFKKDGG